MGGGLGGEAPQKFFLLFRLREKNLGYENENKGSRGGYLILTTWVKEKNSVTSFIRNSLRKKFNKHFHKESFGFDR